MSGRYRFAAIASAIVLLFSSSVSVAQSGAAADAAAGTEGYSSAAAASQSADAEQKFPRSTYMCFISMSAALSAQGGTRGFTAESFTLLTAEIMKRTRKEKQPPEETAAWPDPSKPMIALTFDDGPYSPVTDRILGKLEECGGHATFFVVGNRVETYAASVRRAVQSGCQIGNHTYDHKNSLTDLTSIQIQKQIHDTDVAVAYYAGRTPAVVRPVGGALDDTVKASAGKPLINWSIDTLDWKSKDAESVVNNVLGNVKDGDIVLMHDLYKSTADACDVLIPELVGRGFQLVTVSELAAAKGVTLESGKLYRYIRA